MTRAEQRTLEQVDQKLDDLSDRFNRFISTLKWSVTAVALIVTAAASIVLAFKKG